MTSSRKGKRAELLPQGFLEDIEMQIKDRSLTEGLFPAIPYSDDREAFIKKLASIFACVEHDRLAFFAAVAMEGVSAWRDVLCAYIDQKRQDPHSSYEHRFALEDHAKDGIRVAEGYKKGGKKSAETRRNDAEVWWAECVREAKKMLANGTSKHKLASELASRYRARWGKSAHQIRNVLQNAGVLEKRQ